MTTLTSALMLIATLNAPVPADPSAHVSVDDQPITVIATVKVKADSVDAFKKAALKMLALTRQEAGVISYDFNQGTNNPVEFSTIELWKSQADIDAHMSAPHMQEFFKEVGDLFEVAPSIVQYRKFEN